MKFKRNIIFNKRNGQVSITIPSKKWNRIDKKPRSVFIEISDSLMQKKVSMKKGG